MGEPRGFGVFQVMGRARILAAAGLAILATQAAATYALHRDPFLPSVQPLTALPPRLGDWIELRDLQIDPGSLDVLAPDDSLDREYQLATGPRSRVNEASLFVAYYKTQLRAKNAHDPKVCLPGAGWNPTDSRVVKISAPESGRFFLANYYHILRGNEAAIMIYWFQTYKGVYTREQELSLHRVLDSMFDNRTDMALVRVVAPIGEDGADAAGAGATALAKAVYPQMLHYFPGKERSGS
jgi:EpsI family protein